MKCCILYNQPAENALPDELDILDQVDWIEINLNKMGICTFRKGITNNFINEISLLAKDEFDFVFNLVESINNKGELLYFIPAVLNMYELPYTGNPLEAMFLTTSKLLTAKILKKAGIKTPETFDMSSKKYLKPGEKYIIKPVWEDGSQGITAESVFVYGPEYEKKILGLKQTHWLIQEFIEGREFNISIVGGQDSKPEILPIAEMMFRDFGPDRPTILDFKAKWIEGSFEYENTIRQFPGDKLDKALKMKMENIALKCWNIFGLKGYARVDIRVDKNNNPFVIEINANPCISHNGGFVAATEEAGYEFTEVLKRIINDLNC
ncbi:MAG: ATP-grasp domain-containing protein [Bacteroidales bacterium]|nr:ATP-grasp domain-containing protein [Bacteroidales bacterium]